MCRWDITGSIKMKRIFLSLLCLLCFALVSEDTFAQRRTKIQDGLYIVDYGGRYIIEDDVNQRSVSITIAQQRIDSQNSEEMYQVVCGSFSKLVTKFALKAAVKEGIKQAVPTGGTSLIASFTAEIASWLYDKSCTYCERRNNNMRNNYGR